MRKTERLLTASRVRWIVVAVGFVSLSLAFSLRSTLGLMMPRWSAELGWSASLISSAGAAALVVMAVLAPIAGNLVDRGHGRRLLVSGLLFLAAGAFALSRMSDSLSFFLSFSGVSAVAFAVIAMHVVATAVSPFFQARRGLAVGLATAGATAGQLFVIPAFAAVSDRAGWRAAYLVLALTAVAVAAVAFVALPRREGGGKPRPEASAPSVLAGLAEMLRAPSFHALFWSYAICGFTTAGVVETHLMAYTAFCGIGPVTGATAFGLLSAVNMGGMILAGHLSDRMPRALVLSSIYAARAGSFILLLQVGGAPGVLFVFAVLFGLFDYSTVPVTAGLVAERLGLRLMGLTMGVLATGHALGAAAGSFIGGYLFDISSHYGHTWVLSSALALIASFVVLPLARFRPAVSLP